MQHFYKNIPGWAAFGGLYIDMVSKFPAGSRFIEVGSWLGRSAALMGVEIENSGKAIEFICVDPWKDGGPDLRDTPYYRELGVHEVYDVFTRNVAPVIHRIKAMRMTSIDATRYFDDHSVDFLMLDGDHSYDAVMSDLHAWQPKMKRGSIISGDDYTWPGVETAVNKVFNHSRVNASINGGYAGSRRKADYKLDSSYWWVQL